MTTLVPPVPATAPRWPGLLPPLLIGIPVALKLAGVAPTTIDELIALLTQSMRDEAEAHAASLNAKGVGFDAAIKLAQEHAQAGGRVLGVVATIGVLTRGMAS